MLLDEMLTLANPRKSSKTCWETPASKHISQGHFLSQLVLPHGCRLTLPVV
jgi:hypothetical protein